MAHPELLAPAGDPESLAAALAAGADAVYFGVDEGFNARARAANFPVEGLPQTVATIHNAGARACLTLNTLVFEGELPAVERLIRAAAQAGVDVLIVQDPAVALLARELCPQLELHASTQMTIASPAAARFAQELGCTRVVVPRELSLDEIRRFKAESPVELEVFVHGALCVSWSGQCLTSEAWGGRSANRGQCAQSCRLPYGLVVDGQERELGEHRYLLSPRDLAGASALPELLEIGVHGLKIEGRQKGRVYVSTAVGGYRAWLDALLRGAERAPAEARLQRDLRDMALSYTRGFSEGFFRGADHQTLVDGRFPKHRGLYVGVVRGVRGAEVEVQAEGAVALRPGLGVVFDAGHPEDRHEPGGPIFAVSQHGAVLRLGFGQPGPDLGRVRPGHRVWATSDPAIRAPLEAPEGRNPLHLVVRGQLGEPLAVEARSGAARVVLRSEGALSAALNEGLGEALLRDKLGALGGTIFHLAGLDLGGLAPGLHLRPAELKGLRRRLVAALQPQVEQGPPRVVGPPGALARVRAALPEPAALPAAAPLLLPLCRTDAQLDAVIQAGLPEVELDWMELVGLGRAVERARAAGLRVHVATLRVTRPGEEPFDNRVERLRPDGLLVRHWAALERLRGREDLELHGDFSLNVTNSLTGRVVLGRGLRTLTASFDLDEAQLDGMLGGLPPERVTVMLYHRIPTFHTEHCVYAHTLSEGRDWRTCGRPCEKHQLSVRDPEGREHPVIVDASCRNTVFNHSTQSAAALVPALLQRGVRRFRVQLVRESHARTREVLAAHQALLAGRLTPQKLIAELGLVPQLGVTGRHRVREG